MILTTLMIMMIKTMFWDDNVVLLDDADIMSFFNAENHVYIFMTILMMLLHVDKYVVHYKNDNGDDIAEEDYYLPC
jgi:hypothetical protein